MSSGSSTGDSWNFGVGDTGIGVSPCFSLPVDLDQEDAQPLVEASSRKKL
jgi:hypothetical protein